MNKCGVEGDKSVSKELTQYRDLHTHHPVDPKTLTREDKQQALRSLIFLTQKRCGRVKTRIVADGSKQRKQPGYKKENFASPTCHTESIFITSVMGAKEGRKFATIDVPGAYFAPLRLKRC